MKLTIALTLKGREEFTYRWMEYMNEMRCPYKILIADGWLELVDPGNRREAAQYRFVGELHVAEG